MKLKILSVGRQYVVIQEDGVRKEMELNAGDMYCIPQKNTHQFDLRFTGLVIERKRAGRFVDGLLWFCDNCNHKLHEVYFELNDIEKDFFTSF
jgi:3-hydroxyanthranilate 3,4-dioxygenase